MNCLQLIPYNHHKCGTMSCVGKFLRTKELINYGPECTRGNHKSFSKATFALYTPTKYHTLATILD